MFLAISVPVTYFLLFLPTFFPVCLRYAEQLRLTRAALICQKQYRMVRERRGYLRVRQNVVTIQAFTRGMFTRRIFQEVLQPQYSTCYVIGLPFTFILDFVYTLICSRSLTVFMLKLSVVEID